ncbi:yqaJ-like viral recombinase domain-containing protein [Phthorimaea operculella]|nr:yqaJ-like viral recombinase domain-containing protein [Phthorimaea operculella]
MEKSEEDRFLEELLLSPEAQLELEATTRNNNKKWKKERLRRLHSSNFGKICKAKDKKMLAKSLLKNVEISTPAIHHGRIYEKKALIKFTKLSNYQVKRCGIIIHNDLQFLASTPDGLIANDSVIEVKCPFTARKMKISPETINYIELCENSGQWRGRLTTCHYGDTSLLIDSNFGQTLCKWPFMPCLPRKGYRRDICMFSRPFNCPQVHVVRRVWWLRTRVHSLV